MDPKSLCVAVHGKRRGPPAEFRWLQKYMTGVGNRNSGGDQDNGNVKEDGELASENDDFVPAVNFCMYIYNTNRSLQRHE